MWYMRASAARLRPKVIIPQFHIPVYRFPRKILLKIFVKGLTFDKGFAIIIKHLNDVLQRAMPVGV